MFMVIELPLKPLRQRGEWPGTKTGSVGFEGVGVAPQGVKLPRLILSNHLLKEGAAVFDEERCYFKQRLTNVLLQCI